MDNIKKRGFTYHARQRLYERSSFTISDFYYRLKSGKTILIGLEDKKYKEHRLVYSPKDNQYFIFVHDTKTDEIITFLPFDYHNAWRVSDSLLQEAKDLADGIVKTAQIQEIKQDAVPVSTWLKIVYLFNGEEFPVFKKIKKYENFHFRKLDEAILEKIENKLVNMPRHTLMKISRLEVTDKGKNNLVVPASLIEKYYKL